MSKSMVVMIVLVFLIASSLTMAKPVFSSTDIAKDTWTAFICSPLAKASRTAAA